MSAQKRCHAGGHGGSSGVNFSDGIQASDVMGLMGKGGSGAHRLPDSAIALF